MQAAGLRDKDEHAHLFDCDTCREMHTTEERQHMACGWEAPVEGAVAWCHDGYDVGEFTDEQPRGTMYPKVCVGFTSRMPPVLEITWGRIHWSKGTLTAKLGGNPRDVELRMLEHLETQSIAAENWMAKNPKKKS